MGISSADIAGVTASRAETATEDLTVLVTWLAERVSTLEAELGVEAIELPELPSVKRMRIQAQYMEDYRKRYHSPSTSSASSSGT